MLNFLFIQTGFYIWGRNRAKQMRQKNGNEFLMCVREILCIVCFIVLGGVER